MKSLTNISLGVLAVVSFLLSGLFFQHDEWLSLWWFGTGVTQLLLMLVRSPPTVFFCKTDIRAREPYRATSGSAGADLTALELYVLSPGDTRRLRTGLAIELPKGYEGHVRPRSGLSADGLLVHFGTIDSDYRGEINVTVTNLSENPMVLNVGTRITQLVVVPVVQPRFKEAKKLSETSRGAGGYGSTGR